jgi:uncharacterized LabA/DUF88 family protein
MLTKVLAEIVGRCGKVLVLADGANLARMPERLDGTEEMHRGIDFARLKMFLESLGQVTFLRYYTARDYASGVEEFFRVLESLGYKILRIETRTFSDGQRKGDLDSWIMMDAVEFMGKYDTAVLITGDGDFVPCVKFLLARGKRVVVLSSQYGLSRDLLESGAKVVYLDDLASKVTYLRSDSGGRSITPTRVSHRSW